jgi:hypothetical protein
MQASLQNRRPADGGCRAFPRNTRLAPTTTA